MADPQHIPEMDGFDQLTVQLYRSGLGLASVGLLALSATHLAAPGWVPVAELVVLVGTAMAIANMHLYDKRVRWVIGASGWVAVPLLLVAQNVAESFQPWLHGAGMGFVFVSLSAFALKEQFCFKIPLLRAVPAFLALSLVPMVAGLGWGVAMLLLPAGLVYGALTMAKIRMPLHFDVGNKDAYQI